jgi:hypothetical protein
LLRPSLERSRGAPHVHGGCQRPPTRVQPMSLQDVDEPIVRDLASFLF